MLAQGLITAQKSGVGAERLLEILNLSALNSQTIQFKGNSILDRNFTPRFFVDNLLKDTNLMLDVAALLGTPAPAAQLAKTVLDKAASAGFGQEDYSSAIQIWEKEAGVVVRRDK